MSEFGLVGPRNDPFGRTDYDVLVWEDSEGAGRYRVHLYRNFEYNPGHVYDMIRFSYWTSRTRVKREVLEQDPMNEAIQKVLEIIEGPIFENPELNVDMPIEDILNPRPR